jgi:hypothetical protein
MLIQLHGTLPIPISVSQNDSTRKSQTLGSLINTQTQTTRSLIMKEQLKKSFRSVGYELLKLWARLTCSFAESALEAPLQESAGN